MATRYLPVGYKWRWEWLHEKDNAWLEKFSCGKKAFRLHAEPEDPNHIKNIRTIKTNQMRANHNRYRHPLNASNPGAPGGLRPPCPLDPPRALLPPGPPALSSGFSKYPTLTPANALLKLATVS
ncbi:hypothetical protein DPMN_176479 [Dreissena polymorpha]|uniref:Uncharacterized protein n=1 Tax=Dreissena polymorpha TaxID=45954 RepID=A0A9D4IKM6_DREPO|nr:hypothetical protein DPMN_176479 [Dreissena polymorpha]